MAVADESGSFCKSKTWRELIDNSLNYLINKRYVSKEDRRIKQALVSLDRDEHKSLADEGRIINSKLVEEIDSIL
jgi:hypothetical protein